jgi:hypothetical protein
MSALRVKKREMVLAAPLVALLASAFSGAFGTQLSFASTSPCSVSMALLSFQEAARDGVDPATQAYIGLINHLALKTSKMTPDDLRALVGENEPANPIEKFNLDLNPQERSALNSAFKNLLAEKNKISWTEVKKDLIGLIVSREKNVNVRNEVSEETKALFDATFLTEEPFGPDLKERISFPETYRTASGIDYITFTHKAGFDTSYIFNHGKKKPLRIDQDEAGTDGAFRFPSDVQVFESRSGQTFAILRAKGRTVLKDADSGRIVHEVKFANYKALSDLLKWNKNNYPGEFHFFEDASGKLSFLAAGRNDLDGYWRSNKAVIGNVTDRSAQTIEVPDGEFNYHVSKNGRAWAHGVVYVGEKESGQRVFLVVRDLNGGLGEVFRQEVTDIAPTMGRHHAAWTVMHEAQDGNIYLAARVPKKIVIYDVKGKTSKGYRYYGTDQSGDGYGFHEYSDGTLIYLPEPHSTQGHVHPTDRVLVIDIKGRESMDYQVNAGVGKDNFQVLKRRDGRIQLVGGYDWYNQQFANLVVIDPFSGLQASLPIPKAHAEDKVDFHFVIESADGKRLVAFFKEKGTLKAFQIFGPVPKEKR